jgi:hypothetical protein
MRLSLLYVYACYYICICVLYICVIIYVYALLYMRKNACII